MNRRNMSRTIALVALFAAITVAVYLLVQKNVKDFEKTIVNQTQAHLLTIAKTEAEHIELLLTDVFAELAIVASNPIVQKRIRKNLGVDEIPESAYSPFKIAFGHIANIVGSLYRIDSEGRVQTSLPFREQVRGRDYSKQPGVNFILKNHDIHSWNTTSHKHISKIFTSDSGRKAISVSVPVFENQNFIGILYAVIYLDTVEDIIRPVEAGKRGYAWIINNSGLIVAHPKAEYEYIGTDIVAKRKEAFPRYDWFDLDSIVAKMTKGQEGTGTYHSAWWEDGKFKLAKELTAFAPARMENELWSIGVSMSYDEVSGPVDAHFRKLSMIAGLLIVILIAMATLFLRHQKNRTKLEITAQYADELTSINRQLEGEIIERKQAEKTLKDSEDRLKSILDSINTGVVIIDAEKHIIVDANPVAVELIGTTRDKIVGRVWHKFVCPAEEGECPVTDLEKTQDKEEGVLINAKGQSIPVLKTVGEMTQKGRKYLVDSLIDITKLKQAEEALRASEQRYRTLLENLPQKIFHKDRDSVYVSCNENYAVDLRIEAEEIRGKTDYDFFSQELAEKYRMDDQRTVMSGNTEELEEKYIQDGQEMWVQTIKTPVKDGDGSITGVLGIFWDITEKKKADEENKRLQAQLQQAHKMEAIGTLAGGIAHDFNNILTAIIGFTELSQLDIPEGSQANANLAEVLRAGKRAKDLVNQMLTFSRRSELEQKPLQIGLIVEEALKLVRASIPTTIEIRQNINKESGLVLADPTQIHQVLMNLCTNAAYAMRDNGGVLQVSLEDTYLDADAVAEHPDLKPGPYVRLSVSDTGPGIDEAIKEKIFNPFFTTKGPGEGTGMGLAVIHGIVESHQGKITVENNPGRGATFHVLLPKYESKIQHEAEKVQAVLTGNERILFVDDEKMLVNMGQQMLSGLGYEVVGRTSSVEALEAFRAQPDKFDLVITDLIMPNMTGEQLARELTTIRDDIPVILCTGYSEMMSEKKAKSSGIDAFAMKPVLVKDMVETVRRVLDQQKGV